MTDQNDARLTNQMNYLYGKTLVYRPWSSPDPKWDHDHCAFCWEKFSAGPDTLHEGYVTDDPLPRNQHWVCPIASGISGKCFSGM
ncbi:MAG: hypothetical protein Q4G00_05730 [Clostridia bacterium]|nr:hypothetical protein [Clostridia bacterium]